MTLFLRRLARGSPLPLAAVDLAIPGVMTHAQPAWDGMAWSDSPGTLSVPWLEGTHSLVPYATQNMSR